MRYLGIDYGSKKVGLALSDENGRMGFPHSVVPAEGIEGALVVLILAENVEAVVIGESRDFSGGANPVALGAHKLGDWIHATYDIPVYYEDETMTSALARRQHDSKEKSRAAKPRGDIDASAAALILTSYLSRRHG